MWTLSPLLKPGNSAPPFCLLDQYANSICLTNLLARPDTKGLILIFCASDWLREDIRLLNLYERAQPMLAVAGLSVVAVGSVEWEKLYHLAQRLSLSFPLLYDPCCRYAKYYRTLWVPKFITGRSIFGINASGKIILAEPWKGKQKISPEEVINFFKIERGTLKSVEP